MSKIEYVDSDRDKVYYLCPGCRSKWHVINLDPEQGPPTWEFNGDLDKPTIHPSVLSWWGETNGVKENVCHHYVTDGKIKFLDDCQHSLAGKTVDMKEMDDNDKFSPKT